MAMQMQPREMWELYTAGRLRPEAAARLPRRGDRPAAPVQDLAPDRAGDDELRLRPVGLLFQLARAYTVFAHDGELIPVTLTTSRRRGEDARVGGLRVLSPETARTVRQMLQLAAGPAAPAPKAQTIGYSVGGKTGTAHKQEGKGYADEEVPLLVRRPGADRASRASSSR